MKNAFNKNQNNNWNKDKWAKKENNPSYNEQQNSQKETTSQESSMGKYVREENAHKNQNSAPRTNNNKR